MFRESSNMIKFQLNAGHQTPTCTFEAAQTQTQTLCTLCGSRLVGLAVSHCHSWVDFPATLSLLLPLL